MIKTFFAISLIACLLPGCVTNAANMKNLTDDTYLEAFGSGWTIIEYCRADCKYCEIMEPVFENSSKLHNDIEFYRYNLSENNNVKMTGTPTFILLEDGIIRSCATGAADDLNFEKFVVGGMA